MDRRGRLGRFDATFTQAALKIFEGGPWVVTERPGARNWLRRTCRAHFHDTCGSLPLHIPRPEPDSEPMTAARSACALPYPHTLCLFVSAVDAT